MKKALLSFLVFSGSVWTIAPINVALPNGEQKALFYGDSIEAVVFSGSGSPQLITNSDLTRPSLSGEQRSLDELIFERLVYEDAHKFNIMTDEDAVDKYLAMIQKQNNLTEDELKQIFTAASYTYEEGREELKRLQTVNTMLDFKVRTKVIVPRKAVEDYYREHPIISEAKIIVQRGFIPRDEEKEEQQKKALAFMAKTGKEMRNIQWGDPFELVESEVAEDKSYLFSLPEGAISPAEDVAIGFEVYRVKESYPRKETPLQERYKDIVDTLRKPIFDQMLADYKQNLLDAASILYLEPIATTASQSEL